MSKIMIKLEYNGEIHKLPRFPQTYAELLVAMDHSFKNRLPKLIVLKYRDADNDLITLSDDRDYQTAIKCLEEENIKSFKILIAQVQESDLIASKLEDLQEKSIEQQKPKEENLKSSLVKEQQQEERKEQPKVEISNPPEEEKPVSIPVEEKIEPKEVQEEVKEVLKEVVSEVVKQPEVEIKPQFLEEEQKPVKPSEEVPIFQIEQVPLKKAEEVMKIVEVLQICDPSENKPVIEKESIEEVLPKSKFEEVAEVLGAKVEEKKPIDPDDFSDLDNIVQALKFKNADIYNRKEEPHPIDSEIKTIVEELQGKSEIKPEKKEEQEPVIVQKPFIYPVLQEEQPKKPEEEKVIEEPEKENKDSKKKKEKKEKALETKLETLKFMKEFFMKFNAVQTIFEVPCYKCNSKDKKIWNFGCKKCNDTGAIKVDTSKPKYAIYSRIIAEKAEQTAELVYNGLKNQLKKRTSVEQNITFLPNPYFCVSCRTFPIKGENYICETCLNFAYCSNCHANQYHPHPLKLAYYEEDPKKKQKIFSLNNLGDSKNSPKSEKPFKCALVNGPEAVIEVAPLKNLVNKLILKNNGTKDWPLKLKLECVEGFYKGVCEDVRSMKVGEAGGIEIALQGVKDAGNYETKWKLAYDDENKKRKYFGPKITFTVAVKVPEVKKDTGVAWNDQRKINLTFDSNPKLYVNLEGLPKGNQEVIKKGEKMKELLGGEVKNYIDFINKRKLEKYSIEEIMDFWFQNGN